jgi:serine/threonine protein kinase
MDVMSFYFIFIFNSESVDMWSAGVILYTMLSGHEPFEAE